MRLLLLLILLTTALQADAFFDELVYGDSAVEEEISEEVEELEHNAQEYFEFQRLDSSAGWHQETNVDPALKEIILQQLNQNLSSVTSPRGESGLRKYKKGYVYMAWHWKDKSKGIASEYLDWLKTATPSTPEFENGNFFEAGEDGGDEALKARFQWEIFRQLMGWEGDPSSINTWDNQILTVGAGFSAKMNHADLEKDAMRFVGKIYNEMPDSFLQELYKHGLRLNEDLSFTVMDYETGDIANGNDALAYIQKNEKLQWLMISLAQSNEVVDKDGQSHPYRQWMVNAQFKVYQSAPSGRFPVSTIKAWRSKEQVSMAGFCAHMAHGGRFSLSSVLRTPDWNQLTQRYLQAYPGREEEAKRMISHHRFFYNKN